MHGPMLLLVLSSTFTAGSMRMASEEAGIPAWVWPVLALMIGFLVWWWLRKPAKEISSHILAGRPDNKSQSPVLPLVAEAPAALSRPEGMSHKGSHGPTPQPVTAEAPAPPELEEEREQKLPIVAPMQVKPDDLTIVEGIGPKINQVLHAAGIQSLFQLSESEAANLKAILAAAGLRLADPTTWPQQARLAIAGDMENLEALQATLRGGRKV
jgi:predicted flap endonuclease-1-like 5' DNA nuclease